MSYSLEELAKKIKIKQLDMQKLYNEKSTIGKSFDIPWENHLPVRVLLNYPKNRKEGTYPVYINMHGGGFIEGDALTMDSFCQMVADSLDILVVNLNYRLSPDYVFPYQINEAETLHQYLLTHSEQFHIDVKKIAIGGFSAGATLALGSVIHVIQEKKEAYKCCVCGYPMTSTLPADLDRNSEYAAGDDEMMASLDIFFNGKHNDPRISPALASDEILKQIKGMILFTCGKDTLGKMGCKFAQKLVKCGIPVYTRCFEQAYHGFLEVNRPDYFLPDKRKTEEQLALTKEAEQLIIDGLSIML